MRRSTLFILLGATVYLGTSKGCSVIFPQNGWTVESRVLDDESGEGLSRAIVTVRLMRGGMPYGFEGAAMSDSTGRFHVFAAAAETQFGGGCGGPPPPVQSVGDPPTQLEILVRTNDREGGALIDLDDEHFTRVEDIEGVPTGGTISIPAIRIELVPINDGSRYATGSSPVAVAVADFDGDGFLDIATANIGTQDVSVLINAGDGTFNPERHFRAGASPTAMIAGDFDGDGDQDLAVANFAAAVAGQAPASSGGVKVLLNDGEGRFTLEHVADHGSQVVAAGDFDGDLDLDLAISGRVLLNNRNAVFANEVTVGGATNLDGIAAADFDEDGRLDIAAVRSQSNELHVFRNAGAGAFEAARSFGTGEEPVAVAVDDLDGDGDADLVVLNRLSHDVTVFLNSGGGTMLSFGRYWAGEYPRGLALGDFSGDDLVDLITTGTQTTYNTAVWFNAGDGSFTSRGNYYGGYGARAAAIADLDNDGKLDFVIVNSHDDDVSVLLNPLER